MYSAKEEVMTFTGHVHVHVATQNVELTLVIVCTLLPTLDAFERGSIF